MFDIYIHIYIYIYTYIYIYIYPWPLARWSATVPALSLSLWYTLVWIYGCMYACVGSCMYACMIVCMYAFVGVCMHACKYVCMYACMHVGMYACMHVCKAACYYCCCYNNMLVMCGVSVYRQPDSYNYVSWKGALQSCQQASYHQSLW